MPDQPKPELVRGDKEKAEAPKNPLDPKWNPVCPYCGSDPAPLRSKGLYNIGAMQAVILYCGNFQCRKIYTVQVMGMDEPMVEELDGPPAKILLPS